MDKLKPCPICGGEAVLEERPMGYFVSCRKAYCVVFQMQRTDKASAILAWNTRADDQRTVKLLEALESQLYAAEMNGAGWSNNAPLYDGVKAAVNEFKKGEGNA